MYVTKENKNSTINAKLYANRAYVLNKELILSAKYLKTRK